ncbi:MAG: hypothetical protein IPM96_08515 [Ignavibacteria bacterium]|nr:hypothetical protein [Ignavibacteria bacterium]
MIRAYIDTSVIGGHFDEEFTKDTKMFFERLENRELVFVISDLLELELLNAPLNLREILNNYPENFFERVSLTEEAIELADSYISEKVAARSRIEDCRHIAIAAINKADVIVSWNFKHIVNPKKIRGYNSVNIKNGYSKIEIRSPKELIENLNNKINKDFDTVKMMRDIRDKISKETMYMNFEELKKFINERLEKNQLDSDKKNVIEQNSKRDD